MIFFVICIFIIIFLIVVYCLRKKKTMDVTQFIDLLYKGDDEK